MKYYSQYIAEKFQITKDSKLDYPWSYEFKEDNELKGLIVQFPILIYVPDLDITVEIGNIHHTKTYNNRDNYIFTTKDDPNNPFLQLAPHGVTRVFIGKDINDADRATPAIYYLNGQYLSQQHSMYVDNLQDCIVKGKMTPSGVIAENKIDEKFQITKDSVCTNKIADLKNLISTPNTEKYGKIMSFKDVNVYKYDNGETITNSTLTENINKYFDDNDEVYVVTKYFNNSKGQWEGNVGNADISREIAITKPTFKQQFVKGYISKMFHIKELPKYNLLVLACGSLDTTKNLNLTKIEFIFKYS